MFTNNGHPNFTLLLHQRPRAWANVKGDEAHPDISGNVRFYQTSYGVVVFAEIKGLPRGRDGCSSPIFAFHIHKGSRCAGNANDPFAEAGTHYDPQGCPHPYHAGDLPPLFGANGYAFSMFLTDRFRVADVIGKTIVIHSSPDDFTTQPSGNSGTKIACGEIVG